MRWWYFFIFMRNDVFCDQYISTSLFVLYNKKTVNTFIVTFLLTCKKVMGYSGVKYTKMQ